MLSMDIQNTEETNALRAFESRVYSRFDGPHVMAQ